MLTLICDGCDGDFVYADLYPLGDFDVPDGDWFCPTCESSIKVNKRKERGNTKKQTQARGRKRERDPDAPKQPKTAYILFLQEVQSDVRAAHPDTPPRAIIPMIASMWQNLNDTAKQVSLTLLMKTYIDV